MHNEIDDLMNEIHLRVDEQIQQSVPAHKYGVVTSYNAAIHKVQVNLMPEQVLVWCSVDNEMVGPGVGEWSAPILGSQASLEPVQGSAEFRITGYRFSAQSPPPSAPAVIGGADVPLAPGEKLRISNGSVQRVNADGSALLAHAGGLQLDTHMTTSGNVTGGGNMGAATGWTGTYPTGNGQIVTVINGVTINVA